jgi:hypothetical protein
MTNKRVAGLSYDTMLRLIPIVSIVIFVALVHPVSFASTLSCGCVEEVLSRFAIHFDMFLCCGL